MAENGTGNNGIDLEGLAAIAGTAKGVAFLNLVKQIKEGKKLTAHDKELLDEIEKKINGQQEETRPGEKVHRGSERLFDNPLEVQEYLKEEGWKITKSTIYNHVKNGKLRADAGEKFTLNGVLNYAKTHLVTENTRQKLKAEELQRKKTAKELEKLDEEIREKRFRREIAEGKYISKEDFYLEMASRGSVMDTDFTGMIHSRVGEFVALVDGDEKKTGDLARELTAEKDRILNNYATTKEFQVIYEVMDDGSAESA